MRKRYIAVVILFVVAVVIYVGPRPEPFVPDPHLPTLTAGTLDIEEWVKAQEAAHPTLKPGNGAEIVWADSAGTRTPYAMVYLHGFSASKFEADPLHRPLAREFGCNLYLPRMVHHGLDTVGPLSRLTAENYLESAKEALAVGKLLGDSVILICCSTGATHGLYLAAHHPEVAGLILLSPNIELAVPGAGIIMWPWGWKLAQAAFKGKERCFEADAEFKKYWTTCYRLEGILAVQRSIQGLMISETFAAVRQPVMLGYYYKDEVNQDHVVSVPAMRRMYSQLGTPPHRKWDRPFPEAGEHVICSPLRSAQVDDVVSESRRFVAQIMGLRPRTQRTE
jgi:pimeloyl-ACP methyl ester carboxylesterase